MADAIPFLVYYCKKWPAMNARYPLVFAKKQKPPGSTSPLAASAFAIIRSTVLGLYVHHLLHCTDDFARVWQVLFHESRCVM